MPIPRLPSLARLTVATLALSLAAGAAAVEPTPAGPPIAKAVAMTMQTQHYSGRIIDDEISEAWFDAYLDRLDYGRTFLLQSDIDGFAEMRDTLDDDIRRDEPRLTVAYGLHNRLMDRMRERIAFAMGFLDKGELSYDDPDAAVDIDGHDDPWPTSTEQLDELWSKRLTEQVLRMELAGEPRDETLERLKKRYQRMLQDRESLTGLDVLEIYLSALTATYDPHSSWFKPITKENFDIDMADSLTGIGAVLTVDDGYTTIRELIPGGPAEASGLLAPGDRIVAVAQDVGDAEDVVDMRLDLVVQLIRGPVDTEVNLTIYPGDATDPSDREVITLVRDKVKIAKAAAEGEVKDVRGLRIGVIDVPSFYVDSAAREAGEEDYGSTSRDMAKILAGFEADGVDAVVVDLRRNGGGALDEAISTTGLFLEGGPVVQVRDGRGRKRVLSDEDRQAAWSGPLTVLVDEASASASEIFAAAIQDHGRGLVVGATSTHGKGTVQQLYPLDRLMLRAKVDPEIAMQGGAIKFTTNMFYRADGRSTQVQGVRSDVVIPSPLQGLDIREADLDNPLPWDRISPAAYKPSALGVDLSSLQSASEQRVLQSMEFAFLEEDLLERERLSEDDLVSLHQATRKAELDRRKAIVEARTKARIAAGYPLVEDEDDDAPALAEASAPKGAGDGATAAIDPGATDADADAEDALPQVEIPDAVLDEALAITRDMVQQLRS